MKLATYATKGIEYVGSVVADGKVVVDLAAADRALARREKRKPHPFFSDMRTLLDAGNKGLSAARKASKAATEKLGAKGKADGKTTHAIGRVKLRAPMPNPRKVFCLAGNYQDHIEEGGGKMAAQDKETPRVFMKPPSTTVISPGDSILIPPIANGIDWEGELAVVIGRKAKGVKARQALNYVAGYTIMNDVSERKLVIKKRSEDRPQDKWFDWLNGKWLGHLRATGPPGLSPETTSPIRRSSTSAPSSTVSASSSTTPGRCSTRSPR